MRTSHRRHANYWAFIMHRFSGILLALFLPVHFQVLQLAVRDAKSFDNFAVWAEAPLVKLVEALLIILLAAHLTGGLRLLAIEFLPWCDWQKSIIASTAGLSLAGGLVYLLNAT